MVGSSWSARPVERGEPRDLNTEMVAVRIVALRGAELDSALIDNFEALSKADSLVPTGSLSDLH